MNKALALKHLFPNGHHDIDWIVSDRDGIQTIDYFNEELGSLPSDNDLEIAYNQFEAGQYKVKRAAAYPPMSDYLDGIVKNDQQQINKYIADCLAVKAKYPKPEK